VTLDGAQAFGLAVADFNGDGAHDLATTGTNDVEVPLRNSADTGFDGPRDYSTGSGTGPSDVAAGDVNGDSLPDLVTSNYEQGTGNSVSVLLNDPEAAAHVRPGKPAGAEGRSGDPLLRYRQRRPSCTAELRSRR
jgi:FG-GAP-like repeat